MDTDTGRRRTGMDAAERPTDPAFERRLLAQVERLIAERGSVLAAQGRSLADLGDVEEFAERMVAALPTRHPYDESLGPFYDTAGLVTWLGVSRQAVADRVRRGTLLACRTADGHLLYPSLQFGRDGQVRPGVFEAVGEFTRRGVDGWAVALWLTTASEAFEGHSAVDFLVLHRSSATAVQRVVEVATADAASWAA